MAVKRRGPGRPPKPRGPGRPKGSKNKSKARVRPSVVARRGRRVTEIFSPSTIAQNPPKRGRGRPRTKDLPDTAETATALSVLTKLKGMTQQYFDRCEEEWGYTREKITGMIRRVEGIEQAIEGIEEAHTAMRADADHPTTRMLAKRLIALETGERITQSVHERMNRLTADLHQLRHDLNEVIVEVQYVRNFAEVAKLAANTAEDQQAFELDDVNAGRTRSGSEM